MLRLRLEVVASENVNDICNQATRIATHLGIEVVFELNGKDVVAKPGMDADSLIHECLGESLAAPAGKTTEQKAPSKKAAKQKDQAPVLAPEDIHPDIHPDVQEEII